MDWVLSFVKDDDYRVQEEAVGAPLREALRRCPSCELEGGLLFGDRLARRHGRDLHNRLHVRQILPRSQWQSTAQPPDSYRGDFRWTDRLECWGTRRSVPRLIVLGSYARPHVPQVRFQHGLHRSRAWITWDGWILRVLGVFSNLPFSQ